MAELIEWGEGVVRATRDLSADIRLIEIAPAGAFVAPSPGSHVNVGVLIGERPDVRCYSIVGPCADGIYRIAVKRLKETRGGSAYMWTLAPGARVSISAPSNHFELGLGRSEYLLLAGGIGITPIFTHALALKRAGARFRLLYACHRRGDAALARELEQEIGDGLHLFVAEDGGRVDIAAEIAKLDPQGEFYVCGPIGMLEDAKKAWAESGRPVGGLRFETFGNSGRRPSVPFMAHIPRLGRDIAVGANQTLLEALEGAGVDMIFDCRRGECGLCALPILGVEGEVDHRDVFFSEAEKAANAKLCTCVSRVYGASITLDTADR
jgi:vanillate monooxygenase ferredoxin subunit